MRAVRLSGSGPRRPRELQGANKVRDAHVDLDIRSGVKYSGAIEGCGYSNAKSTNGVCDVVMNSD